MTSSAPILTVELESSALDALGVPASTLAVFEYSGRDTLSRLFEVKLSVAYRNAGAEPLDLSDLIDAAAAPNPQLDGDHRV